MFPRHVRPVVEDALQDTPVVLLTGARQTGKTTLVQAIAGAHAGAAYVTLDDATALEAARSDTAAFLAALPARAVIDEVQRAPGILLAMKALVDRDRSPGRFLLTGSADVLALPRVAEFLPGRMEVATLWPLSQGEIEGRVEGFVDSALDGAPPHGSHEADVVARVLRGGYPEALARERPDRRRAFFDAYVSTIVQRDVREVSEVERPDALRRLLQLASARSGSLLNRADLGRTLGIPAATLDRYLAILRTLYLVQEVPAWSSNRGKRLVRSPRLHVVDTGLAAALAGVGPDLIARDRTLLGPLLESFVAAELRKEASWSEARPHLFHFRSHAGREVDLVLEDARGRVVGIEVKASSSVSSSDLDGLRALSELAGKSFVQGVVLHLGQERVSFAPNLHAVPVGALWSRAPRAR